MNLLWITNLLFPPIAQEMKLPVSVNEGWTYSLAKSLFAVSDQINLSVATVYNGNQLVRRKLGNILYYLIPLKGSPVDYHKELEKYWIQISNDFHPDIVHLHGTEFAHGLSFLKACPDIKSVVSVQGLVSVIAKYYLAGLTTSDILFHITIRDILKTTIWQDKEKFVSRGKNEQKIIREVSNIIGRTSWDRVHTWAINPKAKYYFCNETLRDRFYENKWSYSNCEPCRIFVSQGGYPIKGVHQLIKALPLVLAHFPNTKVYIAGSNITDTSSFSKKFRIGGYGYYLSCLIRKLKLQNHVIFTGLLNENQMCEQYIRANLFVSASSIENSPNSLGEAQLLGVPFIASYVGGTPDMMKGFEHWMYRFDEIEMLASLIVEIFSLKENVNFDCPDAHKRHDKVTNSLRLLDIYKTIIQNK